MSDVFYSFQAGGLWMWVILLATLVLGPLTLLGLALSILARFKHGMIWPARLFGLMLLMGSGLPALSGVIGWWSGTRSVAEAVEMADPDVRDVIQAAGDAEAKIPLNVGLMATLLVLLPAALAFVIAVPSPSVRDED